MNRRSFLTRASAALTLAAAPLPRLAAGGATATTIDIGYLRAVAYAKARLNVSAKGMEAALRLRPGSAQSLHARLVRRGVIGLPDAAGVSQTVAPVLRASAPVSARVASAIQSARLTLPQAVRSARLWCDPIPPEHPV